MQSTQLPYVAANQAQLEAWNGDEGDDWTTDWERYDRSALEHSTKFMAAAAVRSGERVLDVGCGTGESTRQAARAASGGHAHGIDLSSAMLARARELAAAEGFSNITFEQGDAQVHPFEEASFDLAIGRFVAMFFSDQVEAFANIGRALRPGGRLVLVGWQDIRGNEWLRLIHGALAVGRELPVPPVGAPGPFGMADPDLTRERLENAGFIDVVCEAVEAPMWFGSDPEDAVAFIRRGGVYRGLTAGLDATGVAQADDALHRVAAEHVTRNGVEFASATWVVTATRP